MPVSFDLFIPRFTMYSALLVFCIAYVSEDGDHTKMIRRFKFQHIRRSVFVAPLVLDFNHLVHTLLNVAPFANCFNSWPKALVLWWPVNYVVSLSAVNRVIPRVVTSSNRKHRRQLNQSSKISCAFLYRPRPMYIKVYHAFCFFDLGILFLACRWTDVLCNILPLLRHFFT